MEGIEYTFEFGETKNWKQFYDENGFVVVRAIFSETDCAAAVQVYEKYALPDFRGIMNLDRGTVEYRDSGKSVGGVEIVWLEEVDEHDIWFVRQGILKHRLIVDILYELQGAETVLLQSMFLFKRAGTPYAKQAWNPHQDNAYPQADYGMYITGNICFSDQDPDNGGMYIYPGSHREPILPNVKVKSFHEGAGENPGHCVQVPEKYRHQKTDLIMRQGSVLFLHGNVIHGSYPNNSKIRSRPMLLIPYGTKGISKGKNFVSGRVAKRQEIPLR